MSEQFIKALEAESIRKFMNIHDEFVVIRQGDTDWQCLLSCVELADAEHYVNRHALKGQVHVVRVSDESITDVEIS
tara:strand:- start:196 stop:423 length:228 start_codon:yes stop_codon:yes gene_type:complete